MLVRKVFDRPPYLVPPQETWHGRHCGPAEVDDPIPPDHHGWRRTTRQSVELLRRRAHDLGREDARDEARSYPMRRHRRTRHLLTRSPDHTALGGRATEAAAAKRLHAAGFHVTVDHAEKPKPG